MSDGSRGEPGLSEVDRLQAENARLRTELAEAKAIHQETAERNGREILRVREELAHFASEAAHDLRSPLQAISGFASLLDRHYGPGLDERGREFVHWIMSSSARMEALIDGLLAYARIGSRPAIAVPVDMGAIVKDVVAALEADVAATGATVTWDSLPVVAGDVAQLTQLLQHLVANALKFVHPGTTPVAHIGAEKTAVGWCFAVSDQGIGIDLAARDEVFEVFKRLHPQYPGIGVGLAICKRIVEAAGGHIWIDAAAGGGSIFRFTLPDRAGDQGSNR